MQSTSELLDRIENPRPFDAKYPIWKCPECGSLERFGDDFLEICMNCKANHTLDWEKHIVNDEIRQEWEEELDADD